MKTIISDLKQRGLYKEANAVAEILEAEKPKKYTFFSDPGHAWLRVPRKDIDALGIADKISSYSYQKKDYAYLEEDKDAGTFLKAVKSAGWKYTIKESNTNSQSKIRNFDTFKK